MREIRLSGSFKQSLNKFQAASEVFTRGLYLWQLKKGPPSPSDLQGGAEGHCFVIFYG